MFMPRIMALFGIVTLLAACGGETAATTASAEDGTTLSITAPEDGAEVSVPFTVELASNEDLGPVDTGLHHVHIYWDGDESDFTLVEADSVEIADAPEGERTLTASLHHADHTPAGVQVDISLTVGEGGETDGGGGGIYDY